MPAPAAAERRGIDRLIDLAVERKDRTRSDGGTTFLFEWFVHSK